MTLFLQNLKTIHKDRLHKVSLVEILNDVRQR